MANRPILDYNDRIRVDLNLIVNWHDGRDVVVPHANLHFICPYCVNDPNKQQKLYKITQYRAHLQYKHSGENYPFSEDFAYTHNNIPRYFIADHDDYPAAAPGEGALGSDAAGGGAGGGGAGGGGAGGGGAGGGGGGGAGGGGAGGGGAGGGGAGGAGGGGGAAGVARGVDRVADSDNESEGQEEEEEEESKEEEEESKDDESEEESKDDESKDDDTGHC